MNEDKIYIGVITFVTGIIFKHLWDRFIHRIITIRYSVWHQTLALSGDNPLFGNVEVLHEGTSVKNLFISAVKLSNDSNHDLSKLELNIACDSQSLILISHAANSRSLKNLNLTDDWSQALSDEHVPDPLRTRDYQVPVFNRGDVIDILMLVTRETVGLPFLVVSCDHPGLKLKFHFDSPQKLYGESQKLSALVGLLITIILCSGIVYYEISQATAVWSAYFLGATGAILGTLSIKTMRFIKKFFT